MDTQRGQSVHAHVKYSPVYKTTAMGIAFKRARAKMMREFLFSDGLVIARERVPRNVQKEDVVALIPGKPLCQYSWHDRAAYLASFCSQDFFSPDAVREVQRQLTRPRVDTYTAWYYGTEGVLKYRNYVGFIAVRNSERDGYAPTLLYICVKPEYRTGRQLFIGQRLLLWYEALAAFRAPQYIVVSVLNSAAARTWYEQRGYRNLHASAFDVPPIGTNEGIALRAGDMQLAKREAGLAAAAAYDPVTEIDMIKAPFLLDDETGLPDTRFYHPRVRLWFVRLMLPYTVHENV